MSRVLVCGGRLYSDWTRLDEAMRAVRPSWVIVGGANGADNMAERWASDNGIPCSVYAANWKLHGRAAGPIRNQQMLDEGEPYLVLAFPGGRGTADMVKRARAANVRVVVVESTGEERSDGD